MSQDGKTGLWIVGVSILVFLFGVASFGITGGNIATVLIANIGFLFGPYAILFGVYLIIKSEILRWLEKRKQ